MKALPYPLSAWAIVDESYSILYGHENWKMYNGLEFDENFMKKVAEQKARHASCSSHPLVVPGGSSSSVLAMFPSLGRPQSPSNSTRLDRRRLCRRRADSP